MNEKLQVYGIKNCDTVKKALAWISQRQLEAEFHDLKKEELSKALVAEWLSQIESGKLINRRSTTWRNLSESQKTLTETSDLIQLIVEQPTLLKRPVLFHQGVWSVGFDLQDWQSRLIA